MFLNYIGLIYIPKLVIVSSISGVGRQVRGMRSAPGTNAEGVTKRGVSCKDAHETKNASIKDTIVFFSSFADFYLFIYFLRKKFCLVLTENVLKLAGL